ncbi:CpsD/CapB family tyrosine-protein kinase [Mycoplasmatota bacterium WC44]
MEYKVISHMDRLSVVSESYRKLRTNIDFSSFDEELKVINITSSMPSEGKSINLLNLATVYAQNDKDVVVVDLDLRRPKMHRAIGERNILGVSDYCARKLPLEECIKHTKFGFDCMVAGKKIPYPSELLNSQKLKDLISLLKEEYEYIFIDCPPANMVTDANIISRYCDGTIFVVRNNYTDKRIAKRAIKSLRDINVNVIGAIVTRVKKKDTKYGIYYGVGDYYGE